ncbi:glycosyltransferase [Bdellovibrionota bacterium]
MTFFEIFVILQVLVVIYFFTINISYTVLFQVALYEVRKQFKRTFIEDYEYLRHSKLTPGFSLIVPAHNEEKDIVSAVRSFLANTYPKFEVIIVNDGSTDRTLEVLKEEFKLVESKHYVIREDIKTSRVNGYYVSSVQPNLIVVDKEYGGTKGDVLNVGVNVARYSYFMNVDADVVLDQKAMLRIMKPLLEDPEKNVGAGGIIRVVNSCRQEKGIIKEVRVSRNPLVIFQIVEYIRAFTAGRAAFSKLNSLVLISGAFGVFNCNIVRKLSGFKEHVGEDMELVVNIHRYLRKEKKKYNLLYKAYPICWTEVPGDLRILGRQRARWQRGLSETLSNNIGMIFNPRYGTVGLIGLPFHFFFEFLGPLIEASGYVLFAFLIILGVVSWNMFILFIVVAVLWGVLLSLNAILFEEVNFRVYKKWYQILLLLLFAVLENLGYRQMTVLWRIGGFIDFVFGKRTWGEMPRKGI